MVTQGPLQFNLVAPAPLAFSDVHCSSHVLTFFLADLAAALHSSTEKVKSTNDIQVTKTPPNTPDQSRASPVTVQSEEASIKNLPNELNAPLTLGEGDQPSDVSQEERSGSVEEIFGGEVEATDPVPVSTDNGEKQDGLPAETAAQPNDVAPENDIEAVD